MAASQDSIAHELWALIRPNSVFAVAVWFSIFVHIVILSIQFQPELKKFKNSMPSLEVMLVNARTLVAPKKADVLAQANLDRGGNTDADKKMKTALPAPVKDVPEVEVEVELPAPAPTSKPKPAKTPQPEVDTTQVDRRVAAIEQRAQDLLAKLDKLQNLESNPTYLEKAVQSDDGDLRSHLDTSLDDEMLAATSEEIDRLEALIAKQQDNYQKRPRKKFVGARAKEFNLALYVEAWRQKVERIGNLNYPTAAKDQGLYGQLQMTLEIAADGTIVSVVINRSSGHAVLDEAAKRIVHLAAPFSKFPDDIKKEADILSITRTWTFTKEDALSTE